MKSAIKITLIYAAFASLWIIFSDRLVTLLTNDPATIAFYSSVKGLLFVTVTGLILYVQIHKEILARNAVIARLDKEVEIRGELIRELHHRIKNNMQVALGLLNIETRDGDFSEAAKERISNRLISMMSVFNIVYDLRDMNSISVSRVLEEYKRMSPRNIALGVVDPAISYSVEIVVSCLLALDSIVETLLKDAPAATATINMRSRGRIELALEGSGAGDDAFKPEDRLFVELQLKAIRGSLSHDRERGIVDLTFAPDADA